MCPYSKVTLPNLVFDAFFSSCQVESHTWCYMKGKSRRSLSCSPLVQIGASGYFCRLMTPPQWLLHWNYPSWKDGASWQIYFWALKTWKGMSCSHMFVVRFFFPSVTLQLTFNSCHFLLRVGEASTVHRTPPPVLPYWMLSLGLCAACSLETQWRLESPAESWWVRHGEREEGRETLW